MCKMNRNELDKEEEKWVPGRGKAFENTKAEKSHSIACSQDLSETRVFHINNMGRNSQRRCQETRALSCSTTSQEGAGSLV